MPATVARLSITFGLVSIPIRVHSAVTEHDVGLNLVHSEDSGRIRYRRTCEKCGREIAYSDIARGYTDPAGRTAVLTDDDMAQLPLPSIKLIDVLAFVDLVEVDPLAFQRAYYLAADSPAAMKPYALLRDTLATTDKAAVTKVTFRTGSHESLALLRVYEDLLVLQTMYWPDEIRPPTGIAPPTDVTVRPQELQMATSLMETLSRDFDFQSLHDDYQQALQRLVAARLEGAPAPAVEEVTPAPEGVVDLMAALQASIDAHEEPAKRPAKKTPARKRPKSG